ncbi:hypothetical protein R1flu_006984 [Riccia fluitans]|uniref:Reverse transcriptase domain-containing protein n=1 Tax=Riccia fluitans TaxID=41844 RepID=A0ABD1YXV2_9MARC
MFEALPVEVSSSTSEGDEDEEDASMTKDEEMATPQQADELAEQTQDSPTERAGRTLGKAGPSTLLPDLNKIPTSKNNIIEQNRLKKQRKKEKKREQKQETRRKRAERTKADHILRRRSKAVWVEKGEACTKYFFATLKAKQAVTRMTVLRDAENREVTDAEMILNIVHKYYTDLYTQPAVSAEERQEQEEVLGLLEQRVTTEDNHGLLEVPGADELHEVVKKLPRDKSPGEDGLPAEVLREIWPEVGSYCLEFIQEVWRSKRLGNFNTGAVIKLLPKNDKKEDIRNWRPISLLTLAYKIVGRILARRLKDIVPKLIDAEQTGFIKGRSITDNVLSLGLGQELATARKEPAIFCKLDFVKAFDRINHFFLWATMQRMGFDPAVIDLTRALVSAGHAKVHINGCFTKSLKLERGVRQGCPISPLLFAISTQPLMLLLKKGEREGILTGVNVPKGKTLLHRLFADDSGVAI